MKHIKLFENLDETLFTEIQSMIDANQFLKGKVKADKDTVFEAGDFILLISDLKHITDAHVDETIPGSKFNKGVDLKKAIIELVSNNKPTEMTKGFGPQETKVSNTQEAEKFKWLGLDSKTKVGIENVHKLDPNSEEFKSMNVYSYKDSRGNEFKIKVKGGDGEETTFLSFIGAKIGEVGGKPVLSVMTSFPGKNGVEVANRNDFMKSGYYFTTTSKEVIENSTGQLAESKIMRFGEFNETMQFAVLQNAKNLHDQEEQRRKDKKDSEKQVPVTVSEPKGMQSEEEIEDMEIEESEPDMESEEVQRESLNHIRLFRDLK